MPKENRKRGRREEKKRKQEFEDTTASKRYKLQDAEDEVKIIVDDGADNEDEYNQNTGPGDLPFYGLLDDDEQEYFKQADSMLELNQFTDPEERDLFLENVYKEASGKELKIANSQSCSRLMERLILLSSPGQLKALFQNFSGHFLYLVQHRFASHCCEALFLRAAPVVTKEMTANTRRKNGKQEQGEGDVTMEDLFLNTVNELEGNLGYLMSDQFASHPLRVLLVVLSGMPLIASNTFSLLQSKKKEHVSVDQPFTTAQEQTSSRTVPDSFHVALETTMSGTLLKLETTNLRALATHPIANPVLQLLLELELSRSSKQSAKNDDSLFRKLLPDDPPEEGTDSATFIKHLTYDTVGSRLLEIIITHAPGKTFKTFYKSLFKDKIGTLAKNEVAAFVVMKILERLNKEDLQGALGEICPQFEALIERSRTSVIKVLIERCRVRQVDTQAICDALRQVYGDNSSETVLKMLKFKQNFSAGMGEDRQKLLENKDVSKVHGSLLAQCMLESPGPLRDMIADGLLDIDVTGLVDLSKDQTASRLVQVALTSPEQNQKLRRMLIPRFYGHVADLAVHTVASHVIDCLWDASEGLQFIRDRIANEILKSESLMRSSIPSRAVWRNWNMDTFKTRRKEWSSSAKEQEKTSKSAIEMARERHALVSTNGQRPPHGRPYMGTGANKIRKSIKA